MTPPLPRRRAHIGTISVENGTVTIGDPCYIGNLTRKKLAWQRVDPATNQLIPSALMQNRFASFPDYCLTLQPGWGDGEYKVFGTFVTIPPTLPGDVQYERLASVEIVFIKEEGAEEDADNNGND